jgi:hypothetical protein
LEKYEIIEFIAISALGSFKIWSPGEKECYVLMHLYLLFKKWIHLYCFNVVIKSLGYGEKTPIKCKTSLVLNLGVHDAIIDKGNPNLKRNIKLQ